MQIASQQKQQSVILADGSIIEIMKQVAGGQIKITSNILLQGGGDKERNGQLGQDYFYG